MSVPAKKMAGSSKKDCWFQHPQSMLVRRMLMVAILNTGCSTPRWRLQLLHGWLQHDMPIHGVGTTAYSSSSGCHCSIPQRGSSSPLPQAQLTAAAHVSRRSNGRSSPKSCFPSSKRKEEVVVAAAVAGRRRKKGRHPWPAGTAYRRWQRASTERVDLGEGERSSRAEGMVFVARKNEWIWFVLKR